MNQFEKLFGLLELNGIKRLALGDICVVKTGEGISKKMIADFPGEYKVINSGKEPLGFYGRYNSENDPIGITSRGAGVGSIIWCEGRYFRGNLNYGVSIRDSGLISARYLYYFLNAFQRDIHALCTFEAIPALNKVNLEKLMISVPPIEAQQVIVSILDKFTELQAELQAELQSELEARKSQYEFYRESLFEEDVSSSKPLASVSSIWRGRRFVKDDILLEGVPAIHYGEIYTKFGLAATEAFSFLDPALAAKLRFASPGDVVLVSAGETIEDIGKSFSWFGKQDVVIHDACYGIRSEAVDPRYMVHFFNTHNFRSQLRKYISSSKISAVSTEKLGKVFIPVPSLQKQREVAEVLDAYDSLISDISVSLPAEISSRRQQFEYYRSKLLAFEDLVAS
jgi:type I restriction enzyme, S subunit